MCVCVCGLPVSLVFNGCELVEVLFKRRPLMNNAVKFSHTQMQAAIRGTADQHIHSLCVCFSADISQSLPPFFLLGQLLKRPFLTECSLSAHVCLFTIMNYVKI